MAQFNEQKRIQALEYAKRGWHVFPCRSNKKPYTHDGFYSATTDTDTINKWWTETFPSALIGVRTGKESGIWAVDVDMKHGVDGMRSLTDMFEGLDIDTADTIQKTPTGGFHFVFKYDPNNPAGCGVNILPGIDVRGDGGYIVVAPSTINIDGEWHSYRWYSYNDVVTDSPPWALQIISLAQNHRRAGIDLNKAVSSGIDSGDRDVDIHRIACLLKMKKITIDTARAFVSVVADRCHPPFSRDEAMDKVDYAYNADWDKGNEITRALETMKDPLAAAIRKDKTK